MGIIQKINNIPLNLIEAKGKLKEILENATEEERNEFRVDANKFIEKKRFKLEKPIPPNVKITLVEDSEEEIFININNISMHPEFY